MKKRLFMAMPPALKKYWANKRKKKKSTRKGGARKYVRKAYEKSKQRVKRKVKRKSRSKNSYKPRKKSSSILKMPKVPSVLKKVAIGLGAATLAGMAVSFVAPQFSSIARPIAALAAGGVPGVAAELIIDQGILGNITGLFRGGGGGINEARLAGGL